MKICWWHCVVGAYFNVDCSVQCIAYYIDYVFPTQCFRLCVSDSVLHSFWIYDICQDVWVRNVLIASKGGVGGTIKLSCFSVQGHKHKVDKKSLSRNSKNPSGERTGDAYPVLSPLQGALERRDPLKVRSDIASKKFQNFVYVVSERTLTPSHHSRAPSSGERTGDASPVLSPFSSYEFGIFKSSSGVNFGMSKSSSGATKLSPLQGALERREEGAIEWCGKLSHHSRAPSSGERRGQKFRPPSINCSHSATECNKSSKN